MKLVLERNKLEKAIYVGDTDSDRKQAEIAGIPFVFVSYGFGDAERYQWKFESFRELEEFFSNHKK